MAIPSSREGWQQKTRPMARLPSLKSESCNPDASRCSRWVVSLRISSRLAVCITCASRNAPASSLLGGYSLEVPALETQQARQIIMNKTASCSLRNRQRDAREFDWPCFAILIFLIESPPSQGYILPFASELSK